MLAHVQDDVVRPRRIWEQQQMKSDVPFTACSPKYGKPVAPRAAPILSAYSHGEAAASEAVATCPSVKVWVDCVSCACPGAAAVARAAPSPGHLPAAHGGAVANGLVAVQPLEGVIQKGHAAHISKGRKGWET